jgi:hypothetical protein
MNTHTLDTHVTRNTAINTVFDGISKRVLGKTCACGGGLLMMGGVVVGPFFLLWNQPQHHHHPHTGSKLYY